MNALEKEIQCAALQTGVDWSGLGECRSGRKVIQMLYLLLLMMTVVDVGIAEQSTAEHRCLSFFFFNSFIFYSK